MKLRTKTFGAEFLDHDAIGKAIKALQGMSDGQRLGVLEFFEEHPPYRRLDNDRSGVSALLQTLELDSESFNRLSTFVQFLLLQANSADDRLEDLIADVATIYSLGDQGDLGSPASFFWRLLPSLQRAVVVMREAEVASAVLPTLDAYAYCVDVRKVTRRSYDSRVDSSSRFDPRPLSWIPVGVITFRTDEKEHSLTCQVELRKLDLLIEALKMLRQELEGAARDLSAAGLPVHHLPNSSVRSDD